MKTCSKCGKEYLNPFVDVSSSGLCLVCSEKTPWKTLIDEFCDECHIKLSLYRTYYNGKKVCPACFWREINKQRNTPTPSKIICPNCNTEINLVYNKDIIC